MVLNRINLFTIICVILISSKPIFIYSQEGALEPIKDEQEVKLGDEGQVVLYKESHALVIGISDYSNGWPVLPGVKDDVIKVSSVLKKNGFQVRPIMNPSKDQLVDAFEQFIHDYGASSNNRLLFYFAGHGYTITPGYGGNPRGFIVPKEAPNPRKSEQDLNDFKLIAMSMAQMKVYAEHIDAKHALFIFDSCFSGSIFSTLRAIPEHISYKTAKPVRQFITSGDATEEVPDKSIFREQFIAALEGEADVDNDTYITGTELGEFLQKNVIKYSNETQHPQYGKIQNPNLDKGDFTFIIRGDSEEAHIPIDINNYPKTARVESYPEDLSGTRDRHEKYPLKVLSEAQGAEIYIDGKYVGNTNKVVNISKGDHEIRLEKNGVVKRNMVAIPDQDNIIFHFKREKGKVGFITEPEDAQIFIDMEEKPIGTTPKSYPLQVGSHWIRFEKEGYKSAREKIEVPLDMQPVFLHKKLPLDIEKLYSLFITSDPQGADIWVDGKPRGKTFKRVRQLIKGKHLIVLKAKGYEDYEEEIYITKNDRIAPTLTKK